jgi:hypothetical protein
MVMICPQCGNTERFLQRVTEVRAYHLLASPDLDCQTAWSDEWENKMEWLGSDFEETLEVLGIFCGDCGQLVIT